jgi:hypothetical protein
MKALRRSTATPAAQAPEVAAAREWVAASGFGDVISVTDKGRLRIYGVEFDPATFRALSDDDALDALMAASVGAELGDEGDLEP